MSLDGRFVDVVASGAEPRPRRRAGVAAVVVFVAVVAAAGWFADHRGRSAEAAALSSCAQEAAAGWSQATARVSAMAQYVRPTLAFAQPATVEGLTRLIAVEAAEVDAELREAADACAAVRVRPWRGRLRAAREAQVALHKARVEVVSGAARDGRVWFESQERLHTSGRRAAEALAAAEPHPPWAP